MKHTGWLCRDKSDYLKTPVAFYAEDDVPELSSDGEWAGNDNLAEWSPTDFKKKYPKMPVPGKGTKKLVELEL